MVVFKKLPKGTSNPIGVLFVAYSIQVAADLKALFVGSVDQFTDAVSRNGLKVAFSQVKLHTLS